MYKLALPHLPLYWYIYTYYYFQRLYDLEQEDCRTALITAIPNTVNTYVAIAFYCSCQ